MTGTIFLHLGNNQDMALDRAKNRLQEVLQKRGCRLPSYSTQKDGPAHNPTFTTTVTINRAGRTIYTAQASASQKRRAEKLCAQKAFPAVLNLLDNMTDDDLELVGPYIVCSIN